MNNIKTNNLLKTGILFFFIIFTIQLLWSLPARYISRLDYINFLSDNIGNSSGSAASGFTSAFLILFIEIVSLIIILSLAFSMLVCVYIVLKKRNIQNILIILALTIINCIWITVQANDLVAKGVDHQSLNVVFLSILLACMACVYFYLLASKFPKSVLAKLLAVIICFSVSFILPNIYSKKLTTLSTVSSSFTIYEPGKIDNLKYTKKFVAASSSQNASVPSHYYMSSKTIGGNYLGSISNFAMYQYELPTKTFDPNTGCGSLTFSDFEESQKQAQIHPSLEKACIDSGRNYNDKPIYHKKQSLGYDFAVYELSGTVIVIEGLKDEEVIKVLESLYQTTSNNFLNN